MNDLQIIEQLLSGYHLEPKELKRAEVLINNLNTELKSRV